MPKDLNPFRGKKTLGSNTRPQRRGRREKPKGVPFCNTECHRELFEFITAPAIDHEANVQLPDAVAGSQLLKDIGDLAMVELQEARSQGVILGDCWA